MTSSDTQRARLFLAERLGQASYALLRRLLPVVESQDPCDLSADQWRELGLTETACARVLDPAGRRNLDERLRRMEREGIRVFSPSDGLPLHAFPTAERLPPLLFAKGDPARLRRPGLGVVGTRKPSAYARQITGRVALEAALRSVAVISGAALGIDTEAHEGALAAGGMTVAVLGCGLFHCYPPRVGPLLERIAGTGAVLSQFAPMVPPDRKTFPIRNEVIAALSEAVAVMEGAADSGARHTAEYARALSVPLFALPGEITRPQAHLPNRLIAEGARPILRPADPVDPLSAKASVQEEFVFGAGPDTRPPARETGHLSEGARRVLEAISGGLESADELLSGGFGTPGDVNQALLDLELAGFVRQEAGRRYRLLAAVY